MLRILAAPCPAWMRVIVLLALDCAIRSGTARTMPLSAYDPERGTLQFRTKHGAWQELPVTPELAALLPKPKPGMNEDAAITAHLFAPSRGEPRTPSKSNMAREWAKLLKAAGVRPSLHLHDLRRTTARGAYTKTGHDLRAIQGLLGHRHITTTLWYLGQKGTAHVPVKALLRLASERVQ